MLAILDPVTVAIVRSERTRLVLADNGIDELLVWGVLIDHLRMIFQDFQLPRLKRLLSAEASQSL